MQDIKKMIVDELKEAGVDIAEDAATAVVRAVFKVIPKVALATENKIDDMFVPVLGIIEPQIIKLVDKIDGKVDAV